jgi:hypothetical protein
MGQPRTDGEGASAGRSKVARVIEEYGLDGLDEELVRLWTADDSKRYSLRELETYVNERILRAAMRDAGMDPLMGEVENLYRLLTDDETSEGVRLEARRRLEREGVDVETVQRDFVSHQSIHTYLKEHRNATYDRTQNAAERVSKARETVLSLQNRTEAVTRGTIETLRNAGALDLEEFEVFVDVRVACDECGRYYEVDELLDRGGCSCQQ